MTTGLDCSILVQLAMSDHALHQRTLDAFEAELGAGYMLRLVPLVASEFLHVVTDRRRFATPLSMTGALDWLATVVARPEIGVVTSGPEDLTLTLEWLRRFQLGRKRILDTQMAAALHRHGVERFLTSNPDDFRVFGVFELIVP